MESLIASTSNLEINSEDVAEMKMVNQGSSETSSIGEDNFKESNNARSEAVQIEYNEIDEHNLNENKAFIVDKTASYDSLNEGKF